MITSYLASEILRQREAEAIERGERSRRAAVAKKAARERRRAAKNAKKKSAVPVEPVPTAKPTADAEPAGNAERDSVMSC